MRRLAAGALLVASACGGEVPREGQVLLYINTDAPLPAPLGQPPGNVLPLFDRLRIELFRPGESTPCAGCSREFGIDSGEMSLGKASIGIVPPPGGVRVRVRLFRSGGTASPEPRPASTLETVVALPAVDDGQLLERTVVLWTKDVARPVGSLDDPLEPAEGPASAGLVGTWKHAARTACPVPPGAGEVCVPGGAFWMGDPLMDLSAAFDADGELERLVILAPFFLDATEVTVAAFRASGLAESLTPGGPSDNPHEAGQSIAHCTYTSEPGPFESYPVNCITWHMAQRYCESLGKTLPTEAQLEYVMSGLGRSAYVWGAEYPRCEDSVFERAGLDERCASFGIGPAPVGMGLRDRIALEGGELVDLIGDVEEFARDRWNGQHEPCWGTGLFENPFCDEVSPSIGAARTVRGGGWGTGDVALRAALRGYLAAEMNGVSARVGFRCSRPAQ